MSNNMDALKIMNRAVDVVINDNRAVYNHSALKGALKWIIIASPGVLATIMLILTYIVKVPLAPLNGWMSADGFVPYHPLVVIIFGYGLPLGILGANVGLRALTDTVDEQPQP